MRPSYFLITINFFLLKLRKISQKHHLATKFQLWRPLFENRWPCKGSQFLVWGMLHLPDLSLADEESLRKFGWSLNLEDGAAALDGVPQTTPMTTALSSPRGGEEGFGRNSNRESLPSAPMTKGLLRCWGRASLAAAPITAWENQKQKILWFSQLLLSSFKIGHYHTFNFDIDCNIACHGGHRCRLTK